MTVISRILTDSDIIDIEKFCDKCKEMGYRNNESMAAMKYEWCINTGGAWFGTYNNRNELISLSGMHPFKDGWRVLFRGAQLYPRDSVGLNRNHMQSWCMYDQLPLAISYAGDSRNLYITTNIDQDMSGKMNRIDKLFKILSNNGIVTHISEEEIFYVRQSVWRLNVDEYFNKRR